MSPIGPLSFNSALVVAKKNNMIFDLWAIRTLGNKKISVMGWSKTHFDKKYHLTSQILYSCWQNSEAFFLNFLLLFIQFTHVRKKRVINTFWTINEVITWVIVMDSNESENLETRFKDVLAMKIIFLTLLKCSYLVFHDVLHYDKHHEWNK